MTTSLAKKLKRLFEEVMSNEDLLLEVLLRLPAKSLIRFKCVSKRWLSLISDPIFCSKHTRLNPTSSTLGIYFDYGLKDMSELKSVSLHQANRKDLPTLTFIKNAFPGFHYNLPVHACNGLLLCRYSFNGPYFVCNVATQTFTLIPQHLLPASGRYHGNHCAYLIFNPSKSPHFKVVLLGLSKSTTDTIIHNDDEYKERTANYDGWCYEIDVYSSEAVVWERKYFRAPHGSHIDYKAVCNGSLHWITKKKFHVQFEVDSWKLIFNLLLIKPRTLEVEKIRCFGECCGRLFIIYILRRCAKSFIVHEFDKDQDSWTMKYNVDLRPLMASFHDSFRFANARGGVNNWNFSMLCVVKEDETNDDALLLTIPGKIISYNLIRNTFKVLHEVPMKEFPLVNGYNNAHTFPLMATLSPF